MGKKRFAFLLLCFFYTGIHCDFFSFFLVFLQVQICKRSVEVMDAVRRGAQLAIDECQFQFRNRRWNCSTLETMPVFGKVVTQGKTAGAPSAPNPPHCPLNLTPTLALCPQLVHSTAADSHSEKTTQTFQLAFAKRAHWCILGVVFKCWVFFPCPPPTPHPHLPFFFSFCMSSIVSSLVATLRIKCILYLKHSVCQSKC